MAAGASCSGGSCTPRLGKCSPMALLPSQGRPLSCGTRGAVSSSSAARCGVLLACTWDWSGRLGQRVNAVTNWDPARGIPAEIPCALPARLQSWLLCRGHNLTPGRARGCCHLHEPPPPLRQAMPRAEHLFFGASVLQKRSCPNKEPARHQESMGHAQSHESTPRKCLLRGCHLGLWLSLLKELVLNAGEQSEQLQLSHAGPVLTLCLHLPRHSRATSRHPPRLGMQGQPLRLILQQILYSPTRPLCQRPVSGGSPKGRRALTSIGHQSRVGLFCPAQRLLAQARGGDHGSLQPALPRGQQRPGACSRMLACPPRAPTSSEVPPPPVWVPALLQHLDAALTQTPGREPEAQAGKMPARVFLSAKMGNHCAPSHFNQYHQQHFFLLLKGSHQPKELPPSPQTGL